METFLFLSLCVGIYICVSILWLLPMPFFCIFCYRTSSLRFLQSYIYYYPFENVNPKFFANFCVKYGRLRLMFVHIFMNVYEMKRQRQRNQRNVLNHKKIVVSTNYTFVIKERRLSHYRFRFPHGGQLGCKCWVWDILMPWFQQMKWVFWTIIVGGCFGFLIGSTQRGRI